MTTMPQPTTSARTRFFPGSRTSLPINVTFVHAVCAKSGPTIDLPKSRARASVPVTAKPGCAACGFQPLAQECHHAECSAAELAFQPNEKPITTTAASAAVFANVNVFWTILPISSPRVFVHVRSAINPIATNCSEDRLIAYPPNETGETRYLSGETAAAKTPRNFANAIATAAIVP